MPERKILALFSIVPFFFACSLFSPDSAENPYKDYQEYHLNSGLADADQDGIPDAAEAPKSLIEGLPLYDWGARPNRRDLFIHVATMDYSGGDGGFYLQKDALKKVVDAFAAQNIAVHFDVGRKGTYNGFSSYKGDEYNLSDRNNQVAYSPSVFLDGRYGHPATVSGYKSTSFPSNRRSLFYFLVYGGSQELDGSGGSSGVAYVRGEDFLVTFGNWGLSFGSSAAKTLAINYQASTIMHEFGHILGLRHGGDENVNYKPNYYSIMNYLYQLTGLPVIGSDEGDRYYYQRYRSRDEHPDGGVWGANYSSYSSFSSLNRGPLSSQFRIDYSFGNGGDLDEDHLNENQGLRQSSSGSVDWDGDRTIEGSVSNNINLSHLPNSVLRDYDDWGNLYFRFHNINSGSARSIADEQLEIVVEEKPDFLPLPSL